MMTDHVINPPPISSDASEDHSSPDISCNDRDYLALGSEVPDQRFLLWLSFLFH